MRLRGSGIHRDSGHYALGQSGLNNACLGVIKFKAKVYNNMDRIHDDITRLKLLHDKNSGCLKYLVAIDRRASEDNVKRIHNWLSDSNIHACLVGEND